MNDADARCKQLRALDKGAVYKDMEKTFFAGMRRMKLSIESEKIDISGGENNLQSLANRLNTEPEKLSSNDSLHISTLYRPETEQYKGRF